MVMILSSGAGASPANSRPVCTVHGKPVPRASPAKAVALSTWVSGLAVAVLGQSEERVRERARKSTNSSPENWRDSSTREIFFGRVEPRPAARTHSAHARTTRSSYRRPKKMSPQNGANGKKVKRSNRKKRRFRLLRGAICIAIMKGH